ncbi:MAG TPA: hypothetical protein VIB11_06440 [Pedococcus sp.]|jgi:hypothetical protein|uniref:hypothetical protein n=1 Tax=Pedococcus sp. TaxID=2860345 RepID=UPI002F94C9AF
MSVFLRRGAFTLMTVFAAFAIPFAVGEIIDNPGGSAAVALVALIVVPLALLVTEALHRPARSLRTLRGAVALLGGYAVAEAILTPQTGPVVAVAAVVLGVPLSVVGLHHAREAGVLLVIDGLVPFVSVVAAGLRHLGDNGGLHLSGSSAAAGMPLVIVGMLYLCAWVAGLNEPAPAPPSHQPRHRPRHRQPSRRQSTGQPPTGQRPSHAGQP